MLKKYSIFLLVFIMVSTLLLSGCGSPPAEVEEPNNSEAETTLESGSMIEGGNVVVRIEQDIDSLDPHLSAASGTEEIIFNIYEGLIKPNEKGELCPAVAESYEVAEEGLKYTFKLREGIKFHNGEAVTVDDVKFTFDRLMGVGEEKPLSSIFNVVKSIETQGEDTVIFTLSDVDASFLSNLNVAILPESNKEQFATDPIGTGPFKLVEYLPEQRVVLEKFEDYWDDKLPHIDSVEFRILPDLEAALLSFRAGEIDIFPRLPNDRVAELGSDVNTVQGLSNMVQLMALNNAVEPFNDLKVRQAINYAVDVDEIIEAVSFGYGAKLGSNMSPVMAVYYKEGLENTYNLDIEKAKKLLEEAGYPNGFNTTVSIPSNYQFHVDTGQVIVQQLAKIGIEAEIELVEWGVWLERIYKNRDYNMTIIAFTGKLDPNKILYRYKSDYASNFVNFNNPVYDKIIEDALVEIDQEKRADLYKQAQEILVDESASVYIMDPEFSVAMNNKLDGYKIYPIYVQDMANIRFTK